MTIESSGMADDNLEVRYREAEAAYRLAKAEYERKQSLAADKIVSESEMQKVRGDYEQAEAKYRKSTEQFRIGQANRNSHHQRIRQAASRCRRTICGGRTTTHHNHAKPQPANPRRGAAPLL